MKPKEEFLDFLQPDGIWENFGIFSRDDFNAKYIIRGKFHKNVPELIRKDYRVVEMLQFYSYYNFKLVDEAFGKITRIFEASVNLKVTDLGISKKKYKTLHGKIEWLEKQMSSGLLKDWLRAKELRNYFAHHKAGQVFGIAVLGTFIHIINMINSIFLDSNEVIEKAKTRGYINELIKSFNQGLFVLDYNDIRLLVHCIKPNTAFINNFHEKSFWIFQPVLGNKQVKELLDFPKPIMLNLKNIKILNNCFTAEILETNKEIHIESTTNEIDLESYKNHVLVIENIDERLKNDYEIETAIAEQRAITKFIYSYTWE